MNCHVELSTLVSTGRHLLFFGRHLRPTGVVSRPGRSIAARFHHARSSPRAPGDDDFSTRWKLIKRRFTERWIARGGAEGDVTGAQAARGSRGIWQKRFWEHLIRDEEDLEAHCDYIHYNAVKHGHVRSPKDWPYSSFHRFVKLGHYSNDWGRQEPPSIAGLSFE